MKRSPFLRQTRLAALILIAPLVLFLVLVLGYPLVADIFYSFSDVDFENIRAPGFSGLQNYAQVLRDGAFWGALGFSLRFALAAMILEVGLGFALAIILEPILDRHKPLLAILLLPLMIAPVLMGIMFRLILNEFVGPIPQYLAQFDIFISFMTQPYLVPTLVAIEVLQWTPFAFLILFTGLQNIPGELPEAARVDGANPWQMFRYITVPMLVPALAIASFIRFVDAFRVFDHIFVLTGGGPGTLTTSISIYIYKTFFQQQLLGQAIAASMLLLILSLAPLALSMRFVVRRGS